MSDNGPGELRVTVGTDARVRQLLCHYHSQVEVVDRAGNRGVGVTNLKRMFGHPDELATLVAALADTLVGADAVAAADPGAAPLTAAVALVRRVPTVFLRSTPKTHFLS